MADWITDFILKPAPHFAAGVVLFGAVWGFFKGVESVLNEETKVEIWVWLAGAKPLGPKMEPWPDTFAKLFDRVFGTKHLSWKCFGRSCMASYGLFFILFGRSALTHGLKDLPSSQVLIVVAATILGNAVPDYISLLKCRFLLGRIKTDPSVLKSALALVVDFAGTVLLCAYNVVMWVQVSLLNIQPPFTSKAIIEDFKRIGSVVLFVFSHSPVAWISQIYSAATRNEPGVLELLSWWFFPSFFASIWLWLYAGSGFILKGARHFDKSLGWFNRRFDIEKHPLSSIGLVSGALVALIYWAAVLVARVV